jgi:hypothetical protein
VRHGHKLEYLILNHLRGGPPTHKEQDRKTDDFSEGGEQFAGDCVLVWHAATISAKGLQAILDLFWTGALARNLTA